MKWYTGIVPLWLRLQKFKTKKINLIVPELFTKTNYVVSYLAVEK